MEVRQRLMPIPCFPFLDLLEIRIAYVAQFHRTKKRKLEEGEIPDKISSGMDLFNNEVGIKIGKKSLHTTASDDLEFPESAPLHDEHHQSLQFHK